MTDARPGRQPSGGGRRRVALLVGGVALLAAGGGGYWLLNRDTGTQAGPQLRTDPRPSFSAPTVAPLSPLATPGPSRGLNARNPFLGELTTTTTTTTTTEEAFGTTSPSGTSSGTSTETTSGTTGPPTTTGPTVGSGPVYVTVLSVGAKKPAHTAVFLVNGVRYTQDVGTTFGVPVTFSYDSTTVLEGRRCARFAYGDEQHTLCPGEQISVA